MTAARPENPTPATSSLPRAACGRIKAWIGSSTGTTATNHLNSTAGRNSRRFGPLWSGPRPGLFIEEWPNAPGKEAGPFLNQSPDFSHYFFKAEGTAFDNDTVDHTLTPIGEEAGGGQVAVNGIPQTSTDGTHALLSTSGCTDQATSSCGPGELFMSVNDDLKYVVSEDQITNEPAAVRYVGMTANASKVYFTSADRLTSEDEDKEHGSVYVVRSWSWESGHPLTLVSKGEDGPGNRTPARRPGPNDVGWRPSPTKGLRPTSSGGRPYSETDFRTMPSRQSQATSISIRLSS